MKVERIYAMIRKTEESGEEIAKDGTERQGERTKDTALQLLPGAPEMMSLSSQLNLKQT